MSNSENQPKQPNQAEYLKNEARDEALSAAEKGLQAAREALEAAERKLAEAQAHARAQEYAEQAQAPTQGYSQNEPPVAPPAGYTAQPQAAPTVEQTYEQPVSQPFDQGDQPYYEAVPQQPTQGAYVPNWTQPQAEPFPQGAPQQPAGLDQQNQQYAQGGYYQENAAGAQQPYGYAQPSSSTQPHYSTPYAASKDHVAAGLLAIFLGGFGIHKFYLGYNTQGFIMLAITVLAGVLTIGLAAGVMWLIAIIEGIIYLSKNQGDFERIYVYGKHEWF